MIAPEKAFKRGDCPHAISMHDHVPAAQLLHAAAERLAGDDRDLYGAGGTLNAFERRVAALLGKADAVFMPSGTMAQQIALRMIADRRANRAFAAHATNHVVLHERDGYARLHGLTFVAVGTPVRLITLDDVRALREPAASLLLELPQREIGGELCPWDELEAITAEGRSRGWHVHMDGARLWECGPFYGRTYAQIAALFDSVYVSFYKGLGGLGGAMLAGSAAFIDEARIWQRRHGGNLFTLFPLAAIAEQALDDRLDRMPAYHAAALRIARALQKYPGVDLRPRPPHTNMLHAFLRAEPEDLLARAQCVAREHGIWTIGRLGATSVPGVQRWEISCGDATLALSDEHLQTALDGLLGDCSGRRAGSAGTVSLRQE